MTFIIYAIILKNKIIDFFATPYGKEDPDFDQLKLKYDKDIEIIECTNYPVICTDSYIDGKFYRNDKEIIKRPTEKEEINNLKTIVGE